MGSNVLIAGDFVKRDGVMGIISISPRSKLIFIPLTGDHPHEVTEDEITKDFDEWERMALKMISGLIFRSLQVPMTEYM